MNGSGGGSCTHGGKAYEAHLNLILPAVKLVESVGNAPTSTCLQGRCIACLPRPQRKTGKSPWCCPRQAEFWRLGRTGWCATYWKIKRAGSRVGLWPSARTSRPVPFQQRTNTSWRSTRSQPAVSRRLFRCLVRGTPPPKPFNCKIWSKRPGTRLGDLWAYPIRRA